MLGRRDRLQLDPVAGIAGERPGKLRSDWNRGARCNQTYGVPLWSRLPGPPSHNTYIPRCIMAANKYTPSTPGEEKFMALVRQVKPEDRERVLREMRRTVRTAKREGSAKKKEASHGHEEK